MSKQNRITIGNICNARIYNTVNEALMEGPITDEFLDSSVGWMKDAMSVRGYKFSDNELREHIVDYILREYDVSAFGVDNGIRKR